MRHRRARSTRSSRSLDAMTYAPALPAPRGDLIRRPSTSSVSLRGTVAPIARTLSAAGAGSTTLDAFMDALEHGLPSPKRRPPKPVVRPTPSHSHCAAETSESDSPPPGCSKGSRRDPSAASRGLARADEMLQTPAHPASRPGVKRAKAEPRWSGGSTPGLTPSNSDHMRSLLVPGREPGEGSSSPESAFATPDGALCRSRSHGAVAAEGSYKGQSKRLPYQNACGDTYGFASPQQQLTGQPHYPGAMGAPTPPPAQHHAIPPNYDVRFGAYDSDRGYASLPMGAAEPSPLPSLQMGMIPLAPLHPYDMSGSMPPPAMYGPAGVHQAPCHGQGNPYRKPMDRDGDVWPPELQAAFDCALRIVPRLGRRKILVQTASGAKPYGRNELIANYIRRHTGHVRSRKQVSSHIQVLKNVHKFNWEWMRLVGEPNDSDPDSFSDSQAEAFGGQMVAGVLHMTSGDFDTSPEPSSVTTRRSPSDSPAYYLPLSMPAPAPPPSHSVYDPQLISVAGQSPALLAASGGDHAMLRSLSASSALPSPAAPFSSAENSESFGRALMAPPGPRTFTSASAVPTYMLASEAMGRTASLGSLNGRMQTMEVRRSSPGLAGPGREEGAPSSGSGSSLSRAGPWGWGPSSGGLTAPNMLAAPPLTFMDVKRCDLGYVRGLPMAPSSFMMWAVNPPRPELEAGAIEAEEEEEQFVFATLKESEDSDKVVYMEDLDRDGIEADRLFPGVIAAMTSIRCPLVHAKVSFRLPDRASECRANHDAVQSQVGVTLTSASPPAQGMIAVTSVVVGGHEVLGFTVELDAPVKIGEGRWQYSTALPNEFMGRLLRGPNGEGEEAHLVQDKREAVAFVCSTLAQMTILQKYVERKAPAGESQASDVEAGEVKLMVAYEFGVANWGESGSVRISHLTTRLRTGTPPLPARIRLSPMPSDAAGMVPQVCEPAPAVGDGGVPGQMPPSALAPGDCAAAPKPSRKRKNLSISIPLNEACLTVPGSHAAGGSGGGSGSVSPNDPRTPAFQIVRTPTTAPGAPGPADPLATRRLQQTWAAAAASGNMDSPALFGSGLYHQQQDGARVARTLGAEEPGQGPGSGPSAMPRVEAPEVAGFEGMSGQAVATTGGYASPFPFGLEAQQEASHAQLLALTASAHAAAYAFADAGDGSAAHFPFHGPTAGAHEGADLAMPSHDYFPASAYWPSSSEGQLEADANDPWRARLVNVVHGRVS